MKTISEMKTASKIKMASKMKTTSKTKTTSKMKTTSKVKTSFKIKKMNTTMLISYESFDLLSDHIQYLMLSLERSSIASSL